MEENEKEMKKLTAEMTTLEDKATEVMNECKQAEVSPGSTLGSREQGFPPVLNPPCVPLLSHSLCRAARLWQSCIFIFYTHLEIYPDPA